MRVLQAIAGAAHGGAETFFVSLVTALARAGLEQRAVIRTHPARTAALAAAAVPTVPVRFGGPLDFGSRRALRRVIADWRPTIVMTWMNRATAACPRGDHVLIARLGGPYDLKYYRRCDHLIAITRGLRDRLVAEGWPGDRVHHIANFATAHAADPIDRGSLDTPAGAPVLLAPGRLHPNKGIDVLIDAMPAIPGAYLWIAGEGPLQRVLADLVERRGLTHRIRFLGWRDDLAALYAAADMVVFPSRREPLGTVIPEAWVHGRPLVAAAAEGPVELITDGVDGLLVPVADPPALAAAINRVLEDSSLCSRLVAAGRKTHAASYTEAMIVGRYLDLFRRLAG
ncbi:MAG: glycosyltransferase family 1 protein [Alphaproteobacteria bacterium]|nr:glycosyltransferase family 1 protein [Alphaproteobacteria bacterium]